MTCHDPRKKTKQNRRLHLPERKLESSRAGVGIFTLLPVSLHPVSEKKMFTFLNGWEKHKEQYSVTYENSSPTSVSINKALSK